MIVRTFNHEFTKFIHDVITELHNLKNTNYSEFNNEAVIKTNLVVKNIQKFIINTQTALRLMYSRTINYQCFIEEKDEFLNLITNLVMRDEKIYEKVYELFELSLYGQITVLKSKLEEMKSIKPEHLGIHDKFCLNQRTLEFQKKIIEKTENIDK
jgi:hypothetical protein